MILRITSDTVPVPKPRMTRRDKWLDPPRPGVRAYRQFRADLMTDALMQGFRPVRMDVYKIDAVVHIPMPASWSQKRRAEYENQPHQSTPDADNILKAICDTLLTDDSRVWSKKIEKYWGVDPDVSLIIHYEEL